MLTVTLLGGASLEGEHGALAGPAAQRHRVALLALLAIAAPRSMSRDKLVAYLWPERDAEHARNLLKQSVHALRRALGEYAIHSAGDDLRLDTEVVACDLIALQTALAAGDLERAVSLYAGPLLDGFHLTRAFEFEHRIDAERERLRRRVVEALQVLAEQAAARRDWRGAVERWRRAAAEEPCNGFVTMRLMEALDASGDRAGAIQQARLHAHLLRQQFDAEPDERVMALAERLRKESIAGGERRMRDRQESDRRPTGRAPGMEELAAETPHAQSTDQPSYPLVGRTSERDRLRALWAAIARGQSQFALITGEAGIGKTRLAEEFMVWASLERIESARTRSYSAEGQLAYAPVTDWLRSLELRSGLEELDTTWLAEVARLLPELREGRPDLPALDSLTETWQRQRFFTGITRAVLARRRALVLLIDDLQWCDEDTLQWLHYLLRHDDDARLFVIGTARAEEVNADHPLTTFVYALRQRGQLTELSLGPLSADETAALASHVAGRELAAGATANLYRETEGHPLFVVESVRAQLLDPLPPNTGSTGSLVTAATSLRTNERLLPPRVQAVIQTRLAQLSTGAQQLAGVAATIGRDFTLDVLRRACEPEDGGDGAPLDSLDELWQRRIIREHGAGRFDFSHDRLREVAYAAIGPVRRGVLHRRVAEALRLHHVSDLDAVSGQVAGHFDRGGLPDKAIPFYQRAAQVATRLYANDEAISHVERALALLATLPPGNDRDRRELALRTELLPPLRARHGWGTQALGDSAARARVLCERVGTAADRLRACAEIAFFQLVRGTDLRAALASSEEALRLALAEDDPCVLTPSHQAVGGTFCVSGEFRRAREHLEQAIALYDLQHHQRQVLLFGADFGVLSHAFNAHSLWHLGYPDRAVEQSRKARELADTLAHPFSRVIALAYDAMLQQFLGDTQAVAERAAAVVDLSRKQGFPYYHAWGTILEGWADAACGEVARGLARMRDGLGAMRATGAEARRPYYLSLLAEQCAKVGRLVDGLALLEEGLAFAEASGAHLKTAELHRLRGELILASGDARAAEISLNQARDIAGRQGARLLELRAAVSLAGLLRHQRRNEEARQTLREVADWFTEGFNTADLKCANVLVAELC